MSTRRAIVAAGDPETGARYNLRYVDYRGEEQLARWLLPSDCMRMREALEGQGLRVTAVRLVR